MLLDSIIDLSFYKTAYLIKVIIYIISIGVPIVLIIKCTMDVISNVNDDNKMKVIPLIFFRRIVAGIIVLMIPTVLVNIITLLTDDDIKKNNYFIYYRDASSTKIEEVQAQVDKEELERKNIEKAKEKESMVFNITQEMIQKYQSEKQKESEEANSNSSGGKTGSDDSSQSGGDSVVDPNSGNGTSGRVTVKNGVFYIPNKRATSDADTPKQSGKYGLNPVFWERLNKFITDAKKQGYKITVSSALRPYSKQYSLWKNSSRPCSERSKWVACPGGSRHGWGIAADLKYNGKSCSQSSWNCNAAAKWAHNNASKYQLKYRMKWEPWHIEPAQIKGGSYGKCKAKC